MPEKNFETELGKYEGRTPLLHTTLDYNGILRFFAVNVNYFDPKDLERKQIVRIDNKHDFLHLDQLWKKGEAKENKIELAWAGSGWDKYYKAENKLKKEWKKYARRWDEHKGY